MTKRTMTTKAQPAGKTAAVVAKPPATRRTKPKSEPAVEPAPASPKTKLDMVTEMLASPTGATIAQVMEATGWQAHSVRGVMAGALKKRGLKIASEKTEDGRVYRAEVQAADA